MTDVLRITPIVPSQNPIATKKFLIDLFGFDVQSESANYIELEIGFSYIAIKKARTEPIQQSVYIEVKEIDELWEAKREMLSRYKVRELFIQSYGMKEFHVVAPETRTLLFVGEPYDTSA